MCFCKRDGVSKRNVQPWYVQVYVPPSAAEPTGRTRDAGVLVPDSAELDPAELNRGGVSLFVYGRAMKGYCWGNWRGICDGIKLSDAEAML